MDTDLKTDCLVTVLMPVYNAEKFLKQAIESILWQTYPNFELIVIDDGSTDHSVGIINTFNDKRIRCIKNETNKGLVYTLNRGLSIALGKYIARMDADDISLPSRLFKQISYMEFHPEIGVYGSSFQKIIGAKRSSIIRVSQNHEELKCILLFNSCMGHPTIVFRTDFIRSNMMKYDENYKHVEDYDFWTRAIEKTYFSNHNEVLLLYRIHDNQISSAKRIMQQQKVEKIRLKLLEKIGVMPSQEEVSIHHLLGNQSILKGLKSVIETENWFHRLIDSNRKSKYAEEIIFEKFLSKKFQGICSRSSIGLKSYFYFQQSKLSKYRNFSFFENIKFIFKCLFI